MKRSSGFTVIELLVVIAFLGVTAAILLTQRANLEANQRDTTRKTAINAMYYNLEEVFFAKNAYYPATIDSKVLTAMDPSLFLDPSGLALGSAGSDYHYEGLNCNNDTCKAYKLTATLEKEATYEKTNRQ